MSSQDQRTCNKADNIIVKGSTQYKQQSLNCKFNLTKMIVITFLQFLFYFTVTEIDSFLKILNALT